MDDVVCDIYVLSVLIIVLSASSGLGTIHTENDLKLSLGEERGKRR